MNGRFVFRKSMVGKTALVFLLLAGAVLAFTLAPGFDEHALALAIREKGVWGRILFVLLVAGLSAIGVPRQGLSFAGGYAYGAFFGCALATFGTLLGCAGSFFLTRYLRRPFMPERFLGKMNTLNKFIEGAPFTMTLTVRCMPFGNNALTNVLAGMSTIPPLGFLAGSFLGYIPQNFIFALLGSGVRVDPFWRICVSGALFAASLTLGFWLFHKHRASLADTEKKH